MELKALKIRKVLRRLWEPEGCFPPGYEYEKERNSALILLGIGVLLSLQFFGDLHNAMEALYEYADGRRVLREGAAAVPFGRLTIGHWGLYMPFVLFSAGMALYHYFYYYRETKSIYLMRRLPKRGVLFQSCVKGPVLWLGAGTAFLAVWYLLYYWVYLWVVPGECLP